MDALQIKVRPGASTLLAYPVHYPRTKEIPKISRSFPSTLSRNAIQWVRALWKGGTHTTKIPRRGWRGAAFPKGGFTMIWRHFSQWCGHTCIEKSAALYPFSVNPRYRSWIPAPLWSQGHDNKNGNLILFKQFYVRICKYYTVEYKMTSDWGRATISDIFFTKLRRGISDSKYSGYASSPQTRLGMKSIGTQ